MPEPALTSLKRWEEYGAAWRVKSIDDGGALVELCTCHGEPVDQLRSGDPWLLCYLARRPSSEHDDVDPASDAGARAATAPDRFEMFR